MNVDHLAYKSSRQKSILKKFDDAFIGRCGMNIFYFLIFIKFLIKK